MDIFLLKLGFVFPKNIYDHVPCYLFLFEKLHLMLSIIGESLLKFKIKVLNY